MPKELFHFINELPLELVIRICNECLSQCSDQTLYILFQNQFPTELVIPFLYKVYICGNYITCSNHFGSTLKVYCGDENFKKFQQLLQTGCKIKQLKIEQESFQNELVLSHCIEAANEIKFEILPFSYLYFFDRYSNSVTKVYELNIDNINLFETLQLFIEDGISFPNLKNIHIKLSCMSSTIQIISLIESLAENCFRSKFRTTITHYWDINCSEAMFIYAAVQSKISHLINEHVGYKSRISLALYDIHTIITLNESHFIDLRNVFQLNVGALLPIWYQVIENLIHNMSNISDITTFSALDLQEHLKRGNLKRLKVYKNYSGDVNLPLSLMNNVNLPNLHSLSIWISKYPNGLMQLPESLRNLHLVNHNCSLLDLTFINFSNSGLKNLFISITGNDKTLEVQNLPWRITNFVVFNFGNLEHTVKVKIHNTHQIETLGALFPNFEFIA